MNNLYILFIKLFVTVISNVEEDINHRNMQRYVLLP